MRVLIACEFSGIVREAFVARGHEAWSCDLLPSDIPGNHYQRDVLDVLRYQNIYGCFDLMIAHPPCTDLAVSGARYFARKQADGSQRKSIDFFTALAQASVDRIAIENPIGIMSSHYHKPDQIIQPWQFGHDASKATCLWLKNLPLLTPTDILPGSRSARRANQTASGQNKLGPSADRWKLRSVTYPGIANAFAAQWGNL